MGRLVFFLLGATLGLTACGPDDDDILFDGQFFRSKVKTERSTPDEFVVTSSPVSASLLGAREAARYEATVYCVNRFGRSDIIWAVGPDSPDEQLPISGNTLTLQGRCPQ
ncbi:MAG: hypothetical protein AAF999_03575 [Pseudomonadota bacterium]